MSKFSVTVGILVIGVAMAGMAGAAPIALSPDNPQYVYDPMTGPDPQVVCNPFDPWYDAGSNGVGYAPPRDNTPVTVTYTFISADPGVWNIATIQPITNVHFDNTPQYTAVITGTYTIGDGSVFKDVTFFTATWQEDPSHGSYIATYDGVIDVYAPSVTITYTLCWPGPIRVGAPPLLFNSGGFAGEGQGVFEVNATFAPVPEPATMVLLALGGLTLLRRRRA